MSSVSTMGPMAEVGKAVLRAVTPDTPVPLDHLVMTLSHFSASEILASLFELEISGLVRQLPGKTYVRVWLD